MSELDFSRLPELVDAVLDLAPNGDMWREVMAAEPGLSMLPVDDDGWLTVRHRGVDVMWLHVDSFAGPVEGARARVMVDGQPHEIGFRND